MLNSRTLSIGISAILFLVAAVIFSQNLATGKNLHYDEFYGLERSIGFDKHNDWLSVYSLNEPTSKKPPLQYWLIAVNMKMGLPELLSLRLWSYIFLLGVIFVSACTSFYLCKDNPWTIPATILLMSCSTKLIHLGRSGMLDAGMSFFIMASLLAFYNAKENPKYWILCGLAAGLGALQKAPIALLFIAILLFILNKRGDDAYNWSKLRQNRSFNHGYYLSLFLLLSWPILQTFRYGSSYLNIAVKKEMIGRFSPIGDERIAAGNFFKWVEWLWTDIQFISIAAFLCLLIVFFSKRWRADNLIFSMALLIGLICLGFSLATGRIFPRYLVVLTPLLICLTVIVISDIVPWKPAIFLLSLISTVFAVSNVQLSLEAINGRDTFSRAKAIISLLDTYRKEDDRVMIDTAVVPPGAYGYFGQGKLPYYAYKLSKDRNLRIAKRTIVKRDSDIIGVSFSDNKYRISEITDGFIELATFDDVMIWKYLKPDAT